MTADPKYLAELRRLHAEGKLPTAAGVHHVHVAHDDDCAIFHGGPCDCEPEIDLEDSKVSK